MWSHCYWDSKAQPFLPSGFLKVNLAFSLSVKMHQPSSVTRWLEFVFKVWIFKTLKNCCFGKMFVKVGWKFCPKLNKPSKDWQKVLKIGQSGEISSNLVTLRPTDRSIIDARNLDFKEFQDSEYPRISSKNAKEHFG